jgi:hypothetical protein
MKKIVLSTKRSWNWKVFLVLVGMILPASFAILPYSLHLQNAINETDASHTIAWDVIVVNTLINGLLIAALGGIGLALANRIGLGLPFVEGRARGEPVPHRFRSIAAIAWITAVVFVLMILFLQNMVFGLPMKNMVEELGTAIPEKVYTAPLYGLLAAISAAITEETLFRLFGLSLLSWLGGLFFHDPDGRPKLAVLWVANILLALAFGAAHLQTTAAIGTPLNTLVITRTIVLNSLGGLAFGWLFWTFGLECAMLAHFLTNVILKTLIPLTVLPQGETTRILSIAGVVIVVLLAIAWAWRSLILENRKRGPSGE